MRHMCVRPKRNREKKNAEKIMVHLGPTLIEASVKHHSNSPLWPIWLTIALCDPTFFMHYLSLVIFPHHQHPAVPVVLETLGIQSTILLPDCYTHSYFFCWFFFKLVLLMVLWYLRHQMKIFNSQLHARTVAKTFGSPVSIHPKIECLCCLITLGNL